MIAKRYEQVSASADLPQLIPLTIAVVGRELDHVQAMIIDNRESGFEVEESCIEQAMLVIERLFAYLLHLSTKGKDLHCELNQLVFAEDFESDVTSVFYGNLHALKNKIGSLKNRLEIMRMSITNGYSDEKLERIGLESIPAQVRSFRATLEHLLVEVGELPMTAILSPASGQLLDFELQAILTCYSIHPDEVCIQIKDMVNEPALVEKRVLRLALDTLIDNAYKYTKEHLGLQMGQRLPAESKIKISVALNKSGIRLIIADKGAGVSATFEASMYEAETRGDTTIQGTGLGLHYLSTTLAKLGGAVTYIDNGADSGSTFDVFIPYF